MCESRSGRLEHPFYVTERSDREPRPKPESHPDLSDRWVGAGHLKVGDKLKQADGTLGEVRYVNTILETRTMYNLEVEEAHTFFVGTQGWLVHNCNFGLEQASKAATEVADDINAYKKVKHLASTPGGQAKFNASTLADQNKIIEEALRSPNGKFKINNEPVGGDRSFVLEVDMGRVVGTKGETTVKVVVGYPDGGGTWRVWSAYPVK